MKKQNFLTLAIIAAIVLFAACSGGTGAKNVTLKTQADSLNYALGVVNGEGIKASHFQTDSTSKSISKFLKAMDESFNSMSDDEIYEYGKSIGQRLREQKKGGLDLDSTVTFNEKLMLQGLVNGLNDFQEGIRPEEAQVYYQHTKQRRIERKVPLPTEMPETTDSVK